MDKIENDEEREDRIEMEIVVDAYKTKQVIEDWHYWVKSGYRF